MLQKNIPLTWLFIFTRSYFCWNYFLTLKGAISFYPTFLYIHFFFFLRWKKLIISKFPSTPIASVVTKPFQSFFLTHILERLTLQQTSHFMFFKKHLIGNSILKKHSRSFLKYSSFQLLKRSAVLLQRANFSLTQRSFLTLRNFLLNQTRFFFTLLPNFYRERFRKKWKRSFLKKRFSLFAYTRKKKLKFFNMHKKLVWRFRQARRVEWAVCKYGKLNRTRYRKLLSQSLKNYLNTPQSILVYAILYSLLNMAVCWNQLEFFRQYFLFSTNSNLKLSFYGTFFFLPISVDLLKTSQLSKIIFKKKLIKWRKWSYRTIFSHKEERISKKLTRVSTRLPVGFNRLMEDFYIDSRSKTVLIFSKRNVFYQSPVISTFMTSVWRLQNWRYHFD